MISANSRRVIYLPAATDVPAPVCGSAGRIRNRSSPAARRIARELGIDYRTLRGTGPGGRIVQADVRAAAASGAGPSATGAMPPAPPAAQSGPPAVASTVPVAGMRKVIAAAGLADSGDFRRYNGETVAF